MPSTLSRTDHTALTGLPRERRELRALADTAATAAGGGTTLGIVPDVTRPASWHAEVLTTAGACVSVRLDARLGTAEVGVPLRLARAA